MATYRKLKREEDSTEANMKLNFIVFRVHESFVQGVRIVPKNGNHDIPDSQPCELCLICQISPGESVDVGTAPRNGPVLEDMGKILGGIYAGGIVDLNGLELFC